MEQQHSRRQFLAGAGGAGAVLALGGGAASAEAAVRRVRRRAATQLTFTTWAGDAELKSYKQIISAFQKANAGTTIKIEVVPYDQMNQGIDARLQAGKGPDLFRTTYNDIGFYGKNGGLQDLADHLPKDFGSRFTPALWGAVQVDGKPYGVPQHTDVSALVYNKTLLKQAGVTSFPKGLKDAWTWDEFLANARKIKKNTKAYPFAMNWQFAGTYRWMNWLYQAGGTMLKDGKPNLESSAGTKPLAFFKKWKDEQLYPPNTQPSGPQYPDEAFPSGKIALIFAGDFLIPSLADTVKKFQWGVTYLPRDKKAATDLGGTAVVVSKDAKDPELAAKFCQ